MNDRMLEKLDRASKRKYKPLPANERQVIQVWLHKMYERAQLDDIEGLYRRAWLLEPLLVDYFNLRKLRYQGSKQSFAWLKTHDPTTLRLFDRALRQPLDMKALKKLVIRVAE